MVNKHHDAKNVDKKLLRIQKNAITDVLKWPKYQVQSK